MTDDDKALVERLRGDWPEILVEKHWMMDSDAIDKQREEAADRIEAQAAEIVKLEKAIKVQASAVRTLQANEETEINILRQQKREWHQAVSSLDSEREANAILTAEIERLREELAAFYVKLSGRTEHASDCATSNAPAKDPGPCDCGPPDDLRRAIEVELAMTALVNEDASSDWIEGFQHACKRVKAVLGETK